MAFVVSGILELVRVGREPFGGLVRPYGDMAAIEVVDEGGVAL